jgi:hypothetical protein
MLAVAAKGHIHNSLISSKLMNGHEKLECLFLVSVIYSNVVKENAGGSSQVPYSKHFNFFETYEWDQKARVFVPGKPFQPNLMCVCVRPGAY